MGQGYYPEEQMYNNNDAMTLDKKEEYYMNAGEEEETIIKKTSFDPMLCVFGIFDAGKILKYEFLKYGVNPLGRAP